MNYPYDVWPPIKYIRMFSRSPLILPLFLFSSSIISLGAAYLAQYGFDLRPCILCLYQRLPYAVLIALSLLSLLCVRNPALQRKIGLLSACILIIGAAIAFYHVGVEHKWFEGPTICSGQGNTVPKTIEEMRAQLIGSKPVRCDQPQFVFLTLSMAGWNLLWSLGLLAVTLILLRKKAEKWNMRK